MKRIGIVVVLLVIIAAGGFLTASFQGGVEATGIPGAKVQCADPACSVFVAEPWQVGQFLLLIGFILFNLIGIGVTLAVLFWFLNRSVASAKASAGSGEASASDEKAIEQA